MATKPLQLGFTLIELIIVIVLVGLLAAMTTDIITLPVKSYLELERRTTLAYTADNSLRRMQRDIRRALPNSIRITNSGASLELLHTRDGGRYRKNLESDGTGNTLNFNSADTSFDVLGALSFAPESGDYLVIYNLSSLASDSQSNAYQGNNRASIDENLSGTGSIFLQSSKQFPLQSPLQRFFIVDTPITYHCAGGELRRYNDYNITQSSPDLSSLSYSLQAKASTINCLFTYDPGTNTRAGLIELSIGLTDEASESVNLVAQVHVDNMP